MKERIQKLIDVYTSHVFSVDSDAGWHSPSQLECFQNTVNKQRVRKIKAVSKVKVITGSDEEEVTKYERLETKLTAWFSSSCEHQVNDRPDDKMISEMQFVRNEHYDFKLAKMLLSQLIDKQLLSVFAEPYLKYVYKREFTIQEVSNYLQMTKDVYKYNKKSAYQKLEEKLEFIDQYEKVKTA